MSVPFVRRSVSVLVCVFAAASGVPQELPAIPPSIDPSFWGRANKPYILKLTETRTTVDANNAPQTHVGKTNVYRDSTGRVRTEAFYDNGLAMSVSFRDPHKNTMTLMTVAKKSAVVLSVPRQMVPPPGKGWTVERLPSRVIAGFPAEGFHFTRTIPASASGKGAPDAIVEEEWISNTLGVVLEQKTVSQLNGTTTKTVADFKQVEPEPGLFTIPADYSVQQAGSPAQ